MTPHPSGEGLPLWELFPKVPEGLEDLKFEPLLRSAVKKGLFQPCSGAWRARSIKSCCPHPSQPHGSLCSLLSPMGAREDMPPSPAVTLLLSPPPPNKAMGYP